MVFSLYVYFTLSVHRICNYNGTINKTFQRETILTVCPKKRLQFDQTLGPQVIHLNCGKIQLHLTGR